MESVVRIKKSLRTPIRKLSRCVARVKERKLCAKRRNRRGRGGGGRGGCSRLRRTPPPQASRPRDPSIIRSYQADLEKERKLREATNAQKNAERAAMRAHFRKKYQLSEQFQVQMEVKNISIHKINLEDCAAFVESPKDTNHLRSVGGKVSLPHELSKIIHPETKTKDDSFNLLSAFQGLSFGTASLTGRKHSKTSTPPTPATCKVM